MKVRAPDTILVGPWRYIMRVNGYRGGELTCLSDEVCRDLLTDRVCLGSRFHKVVSHVKKQYTLHLEILPKGQTHVPTTDRWLTVV